MIKRIVSLFVLLIVVAAVGFAALVYNAARGVDPNALETEYLTAADRFVDIDGLRVRVRVEGPEDAPAIVLMHGFIFSLETWDEWARALSGRYRVIAFDLAGHGLTGPDPRERYSPDERAAFVGRVLDALDIDGAVIGGNSLGGLAAWKFAAASPERVRALILVAPGAYPQNGVGDAPAEPPEPMKLFLRTAPEAGVQATLARIFSDDALATDARVKRVRDLMRRRGNGEAFIKSIEEFTLPDPEPDLGRIAAPTLVLWGADDIVIPASDAARVASAIPGAELIVYEDVGHVVQEEAAARSLADVEAFLARALGDRP